MKWACSRANSIVIILSHVNYMYIYYYHHNLAFVSRPQHIWPIDSLVPESQNRTISKCSCTHCFSPRPVNSDVDCVQTGSTKYTSCDTFILASRIKKCKHFISWVFTVHTTKTVWNFKGKATFCAPLRI